MLDIKRLRFDRNLTQAKLASLSGLNQATISYIEVNPKKDIAISTLISLCKAFDIPPTEFLEYNRYK